MEGAGKYLYESEVVTLRKGIKARYEVYRARNVVKYPEFDFNTNRANYVPLRESFEEEFFVIRGIDRQQKAIHIPSTATLALLFTEDSYIPSQKIWNTCWSYAEEKVKPVAIAGEAAPVFSLPVLMQKHKWLLPGGVGLFTGLLLGLSLNRYWLLPTTGEQEQTTQTITVSHDLVIDRPITKGRVPPQFLVSGQARPGQIVWPVIRAQGTDYYYVQFPVLVTDKGYWLTAIEIYGAGFEKAGKRHQLRAFVNPAVELKASDVLRDWPKAERATEIVEIVMDGSQVIK